MTLLTFLVLRISASGLASQQHQVRTHARHDLPHFVFQVQESSRLHRGGVEGLLGG